MSWTLSTQPVNLRTSINAESPISSDGPRVSEHFTLKAPPYLAIITNRHSCDSDEQLVSSLRSLEEAVSTNLVSLVSVRINVPVPVDKQVEERVLRLSKKLVELSEIHNFSVVLSSDWNHLLLESGAHGIHAKEFSRQIIEEVRQQKPGCLVGTSCHSLESAMEALQTYNVDYIFVGTCYISDSHPEKGEDLLEGPELPGQIRQAFVDTGLASFPRVLAIGGIDTHNCDVPIKFGADGVAAIKSVLQSANPSQAVNNLIQNMRNRR